MVTVLFFLRITPTEEASSLGAPGAVRCGEGCRVAPSPKCTLEPIGSSTLPPEGNSPSRKPVASVPKGRKGWGGCRAAPSPKCLLEPFGFTIFPLGVSPTEETRGLGVPRGRKGWVKVWSGTFPLVYIGTLWFQWYQWPFIFLVGGNL